MRELGSLTLIVVMTVQAGPVSAQAVAENSLMPKRLYNIQAEVEKYGQVDLEADCGSLHDISGQEIHGTEKSDAADRLRAILLNLPRDFEVLVVLSDGQKLRGRVTDIQKVSFTLFAKPIENASGRYGFTIETTIEYHDVASLHTPGIDDWLALERIDEIDPGKRIEVLLLNGVSLRGRLEELTDQGFTLLLERKEKREFTRSEVAAFRRASGMSTGQKATIIIAAVGAGLLVMYLVVQSSFKDGLLKGGLL